MKLSDVSLHALLRLDTGVMGVLSKSKLLPCYSSKDFVCCSCMNQDHLSRIIPKELEECHSGCVVVLFLMTH